MLKYRPPEELLGAIRVIAAGEALLAPNVTRRLIETFVRQPDPLRTLPEVLAELTVRECEVLVPIASWPVRACLICCLKPNDIPDPAPGLGGWVMVRSVPTPDGCPRPRRGSRRLWEVCEELTGVTFPQIRTR
jgi:hypothetical protein